MVRILYKKEILKFLKYHLLFFILVSSFMIFFLNLIFGSGELVYPTLDFLIVSLGLSYTTTLYKKYSDVNYIKINELHGKSKNKIKFTVFMVLVTWLFILTFTYLIEFVIYDYSGLLRSKNAFGNGGSAIWRLNDWYNTHSSGFYYGFYAIVFTIFMVIFYSTLINHFIKNRTLILGINLLIIIYILLFGYIIGHPQLAADGKLTTDGYTWRQPLNFIIVPWTQVGVFADAGWFGGDVNNVKTSHLFFENINYWDYSEMGIYSNLIWTPYLSIIILAIVPITIKNKH